MDGRIGGSSRIVDGCCLRHSRGDMSSVIRCSLSNMNGRFSGGGCLVNCGVGGGSRGMHSCVSGGLSSVYD